MQNHNAFRLLAEVTFSKSYQWSIAARYAARSGGEPLVLPAGTWLLALPSENDGLYRYRLASGEIATRAEPLESWMAEPIQDSQAVLAMNAYRSLEDAAREDFGLDLERIARHLAPFALVRCPLCGGTDFATLEFSGVWCARCNTRFETRFTGGDPGFVVDAHYEHANLSAALYLLPPAEGLLSTLVLKDTLDPRDMDTSGCGCEPGSPRLTDGISGLRAGLHACQVGTLYDWNTIYGQVPQLADLPSSRRRLWTVDGQSWPDCATERALPLAQEERAAIEAAARLLGEEHVFARGELKKLLSVQRAPLSVHKAPLPPIEALGEGERYLLHHWLAVEKRSSVERYQLGLPVWYVVKPVIQERQITGWNVVRRDICPVCGKKFLPEHAGGSQYANRWDDPHGWCREDLKAAGWAPEPEPEAAPRKKRAQAA